MKFNFEDIGCLLILMGLIAFIGLYIYFDCITPDFEEYQIEIIYCDSRPKEVKSFSVPTGLPPEIITRKQAVPILSFSGRGIQSTKILNVCDFKILSRKYIQD